MRLSGIELRYVLTMILVRARRPLGVDDLAAALADAGFTVRGRPSKSISDALRWEVGRERVVRLGRGVYVAGTMPKQTKSRIRHRVIRLQAEAAAGF